MTTPGSSSSIPINWRNLIQAGRDLLDPQSAGNVPSDEHVRRAISNAYYAMFHALAERNAAVLVGPPIDPTAAAAWSRIYRGMDHGTARRELQRHRQEFSPPARHFADRFKVMLEFRHSADYDHAAGFTAQEANIYINQTEAAILNFLQVPGSEQAYIATLTLIRPR